MVALIFFAEIPEWQWHYDHTLDSLYAMAISRIRLYISFQCSVTKSVLSLMFNPEAPFDGIPLFMAYLEGTPLQPFPLASLKINPSEVSVSTSSSSSAPGGLRAAGIMANGFLSSELG